MLTRIREFFRTKPVAPKYPQPLETFFETAHCPDCGGSDWWELRQDGGHDLLLKCGLCGQKFGIQNPPLSLIERVGEPSALPSDNGK